MGKTKILAIVLVVCGIGPTVAQEAKKGWTPEVMIQFKRVGGTAISPDGQLIAYTVSQPLLTEEKSEYLTHIWVAARDGSFNRPFTRGEKSCTEPAFSPDGGYLAFLSTRGKDGTRQVWILPLAGGEAEQVTRAEKGVQAYRWSPSGTRLAFTSADPDTPEEKAAKNAKRDWRVLDTHYKYAHLYVTPVAAPQNGPRPVQRLTSGAFHVTDFDWSPDGRTLVFEHRATPKADDWATADISTVPADSGAVTPLVSFSGGDFHPLYAPNGRHIAFVSDGGQPKWARAQDLYVVPATGGEARKLAPTRDRRPQLLAWSDDSKGLYYSEVDHTSRRVFFLSTRGDAPEVVTPGPGNFWGASWSRDGKTLAFIHEETDLPPDVYVSTGKRFAPVKLTEVNADYPRFRLGNTEVIFWKSKDGLVVEGLLTYPVNYTPDRMVPLILNVHGGPAGVFTQTYTARSSIYPIQAFAQAGYAVLRPNPRGSSGYGKDFRFANYNDWGFGDFDDLVAGVNKVMGMGVAHPDSLCVMGWSYGGYMTSFIITKTKQFKVASVGAGVTNLYSFSGTSDIPSFLPDYFGGEPWDRVETYMKHSAMFNIQGVQIPTQIIHGEEDVRVPLSQGLELYNALKRQGCPTEMIVYPRTPHGPQEPKFIQDIGERILAWFDLHLRRKRRFEPVVTK